MTVSYYIIIHEKKYLVFSHWPIQWNVNMYHFPCFSAVIRLSTELPRRKNCKIASETKRKNRQIALETKRKPPQICILLSSFGLASLL